MESTKKTRKKKEKLKAKTISFQRSGFVEDGLIEKIAGLIRDYLEHTSSDEPSESADPGNLRDRIIAKTNSLFTDAVAKQKLYIELCKKECKKQYKDLLSGIPGYEIHKCCVCSRSEVSTSVRTSACGHDICEECQTKIEYLTTNNVDDSSFQMQRWIMVFQCPLCRVVNVRPVKKKDDLEALEFQRPEALVDRRFGSGTTSAFYEFV